MMYVFGLLTGITLCIFILVFLTRFNTTIERTIKQTESNLKRKGSIIEPHQEEVEDWIDNLKTE